MTSLVVGRGSTDPDRAHRDYRFGEWLRADIVDGLVPQPTDDPDVVLLMACALSRHHALRGPVLHDALPEVPLAHIRDAALRVIPGLIQHAAGDERNALLTMARVLTTVRTGRIVSKEDAAAAIIPLLSSPERELMERARAGYLHGTDGDWTGDSVQVKDMLQRLSARARLE